MINRYSYWVSQIPVLIRNLNILFFFNRISLQTSFIITAVQMSKWCSKVLPVSINPRSSNRISINISFLVCVLSPKVAQDHFSNPLLQLLLMHYQLPKGYNCLICYVILSPLFLSFQLFPNTQYRQHQKLNPTWESEKLLDEQVILVLIPAFSITSCICS